MIKLLMRLRVVLSAAALALLVLTISGAHAQQPAPGLVNPTASAVKEQQLLQQLQQLQGRVSIPDEKSSVLIQPGGRDWQAWNQNILHWVGGIAVVGMVGLLVVFYLMRGTIPIESGRSGRKILRFSSVERFVHWMTAICFIILGLTGLNITFGKTLILPLIGPEAFTAVSQWGKYLHNYLSFGFAIGILFMFVMWISGNIPNRDDVRWIKEGGGIVGNRHPKAGRFNAGQKVTFWVVFLFGVAISVTGYLLMFPFYGTTISGLQLAAIIHGLIGVLFVAFILGHIYIGTLGMEGAFESMGSGEVDVNWAKQHHSQWLEEQGLGSGPVPTNPGQRPPRPIPAE